MTQENQELYQLFSIRHPFFHQTQKLLSADAQKSLKNANMQLRGDVHDPKLKKAHGPREWLKNYPTVYCSTDDQSTIPEEREQLKKFLISKLQEINFDTQKKEKLTKYFAFIFTEYPDATGYPTIARTVALYQQLELLSDSSAWNDFFTVLYEAGFEAYHPDSNPVYPGTTYSCMPGLEERIILNDYAVLSESFSVLDMISEMNPHLHQSQIPPNLIDGVHLLRAVYLSEHPIRVKFETELSRLHEKKKTLPLTDQHIMIESLKSVYSLVRKEKMIFDFKNRIMEHAQQQTISSAEKRNSLIAAYGEDRAVQIFSSDHGIHVDLFYGLVLYLNRTEKTQTRSFRVYCFENDETRRS